MELQPLHTPPGFDPHTLLGPLTEALSGEGPAIAPHADPAQTFSDTLPNDDIAAVLSTSGTTGTPKQTMLSVDALAASSAATASALSAEGQWLLALPVHYVAGFQVLVRSLYAGTRPWAMPPGEPFTSSAFTSAAEELTDRVRFTSLVPTQLDRLLRDPCPATLRALKRFDAILLGGAPASNHLRSEAVKHNLNIVQTYGMSETCGGCVYNGKPLDGVSLMDDAGQLWISGPVLADGYYGDPTQTNERFVFHSGQRWFRTDDAGTLSKDGTVTVSGRLDDVILTGGVKVSASVVCAVVESLPGVHAALVAGVDSPEWGTCVAVAVAGSVEVDLIRTGVRNVLGAEAVPKVVLTVESLPCLANGKPDRQTIQALLRKSATVPTR